MKYDFTNQTVLVTGATGGIGASIVQQFYDNGANLIISGTSKKKLDLMASKFPERVNVIECNLSNHQEAKNLVSGLDSIDILICNAGITRDGLCLKMSDSDFTDVIDINLTSTFILNREAIKKMIKKKYGRIINISSIVGYTGNMGQANYSAAKAGMVGLTKSIAAEVAARNITVNSVAPGFISSPMTEILSDEQKDYIMKKIPMKRFGESSDVSHTCLFLASRQARYITGQTIHVNGGMAMY